MAAVIAIHAGLAFLLLHLSGQVGLDAVQSPLRVFDLDVEVPPPPPPPPVQKQAEKQKPKAK